MTPTGRRHPVKLVRRSSEAPQSIRRLMDELLSSVAPRHGLFVGAVCETWPGARSAWRGILIASGDPTGGVGAASVGDMLRDPRSLALLLHDEANPRAPGETWHLRVADPDRAADVFLAPWAGDLALALRKEVGADRAVAHLEDAQFYAGICDPHVDRLLCLERRGWWRFLRASVVAAGLTPIGDEDVFMDSIAARPRDLFSAAFFIRGDRHGLVVLGAVRLATESAAKAMWGGEAERADGAALDHISLEVRCEAPAGLAEYLAALGDEVERRPITPGEEDLIHATVFRTLGLSSARRTADGRSVAVDVAVVISADDPHLLLSFTAPAVRLEDPRVASGVAGSMLRGLDLVEWRRNASAEARWAVERAWDVINGLSMGDDDVADSAAALIEVMGAERGRIEGLRVVADGLPRAAALTARPESGVSGSPSRTGDGRRTNGQSP